MKKLILLLLLCCPSASIAQSVSFETPIINGKANRPVFVTPKVDGDDLMWEIDKGLDDWVKMLPGDVAKNFGASKIFYADKGTYIVRAWTAKIVDGKAKLSPVATVTIVIEGGAPPVPPTPPVPVPGSAILGDGGLRVLMIYETAKTLPIKQSSILTGKEIRDYLIAKTAPMGPSKRGFYIVDKDVDFSAEVKEWGLALSRPRTSVPWIIISSEKGNYEGPFPADVAATMELLRKY